MQFSVLVATLLATAVAAGPVDLLDLDKYPESYPTTTACGYPHGGYPTGGYPTGGIPTSSTTPGGGSPTSSTTPGGGNPTSSTTPGGGNPTSSTTPGGGNPTSSTTPGGGNPTSSTTPGGGNPTSSTTPGGGNPTSSTTPGGGSSTTTPNIPYPTGYVACPNGLYSVPQCCATDVLGLADLDCHSPAAVFNSPASFRKTCAAGGNQARCCVVPVAGQSVLCITPAGV
ncbi:fungal hydrophobin-domain-containing protein [Xylaria palmicola]|nr:fungal hydrophobin-domain-containing protein [Xylaria palmicola]